MNRAFLDTAKFHLSQLRNTFSSAFLLMLRAISSDYTQKTSTLSQKSDFASHPPKPDLKDAPEEVPEDVSEDALDSDPQVVQGIVVRQSENDALL
jgi:hypothetical protein